MKFEKLDLVKFDSVELNEESKTFVKGGITTYVVSAKKDGDGTISDAKIDNNDQHD